MQTECRGFEPHLCPLCQVRIVVGLVICNHCTGVQIAHLAFRSFRCIQQTLNSYKDEKIFYSLKTMFKLSFVKVFPFKVQENLLHLVLKSYLIFLKNYDIIYISNEV